MFIKARWLPCVILTLVVLFAIVLVVHEVNRVYTYTSDELLLRFGESKAGTFEAAVINDDPNVHYQLYIEKGGNSSHYDLESNVYQTFGFTYGDGDYKVTLYQRGDKANKKNVKAGEATIRTTVSTFTAGTNSQPVTTADMPIIRPVVDTSVSYEATWELRSYTHSNGKTIEYWINVPEGATSGMPILMFLHGDSEMGKPNSVAKLRQVKYMRESKEYIAIAPVGKNRDWTSDKVQEALKGLLDDNIAKYQIDTSRIYIWGFSRGSIGTWGMVERYGSYFKAAVPISCGSYNGSSIKAESFSNTKVYALAGSKETKYIRQMRTIVNKIVEAGGSAKFETVAGQSHKTMSKNFPYVEVIDNWLLKQ